VSKGTAYWVNAADPHDCSSLEFSPVINAKVIVEQNLLLSDFISLGLLSEDGAIWKSPRLCGDELRILSIEDEMASGVGCDR
jgi:hypothetical protein